MEVWGTLSEWDRMNCRHWVEEGPQRQIRRGLKKIVSKGVGLKSGVF